MSPRTTVGRRTVSFHGALPAEGPVSHARIHRPESHPELQRFQSVLSGSQAVKSQGLTKLLINVTVQGSLGPVHVILSLESSVEELIKAAVEAYVREGRRPLLSGADPQCFDLHYSQFSLESLNPNERLMNLGSRNFFLCPRQRTGTSSCSNEVTNGSKATTSFSWLRFMDYLFFDRGCKMDFLL